MSLFIDTWGWVSLHNRREQFHEEASEYYRGARREGRQIYTSDYVLDETYTMLFKRLGADAERFVENTR